MKSTFRDVLETLLLTLIIFLAVQSVVKNFKVEGTSMIPTLGNGEYLLVNKIDYWTIDNRLLHIVMPQKFPNNNQASFIFSGPSRGDIVVFEFPRDTSRDFIKRIIGLPGDVVEIHGGKVFVNGIALQEPYIEAPPRYVSGPVRVPPGHYYVLGDNRNSSSDSHVWGLVPERDLIGKAWISYWPMSRWGILTSNATTGQAQNN